MPSNLIAATLLTLFAPIVLIFRAMVYGYALATEGLTRRRSRKTCLTLGDRMESGTDIGDQFLRDNVAAARLAVKRNTDPNRRAILQSEFQDALEALGESGAAAGVPVLGAEREYQLAQSAYRSRNKAEARRASAASKLFDPSWRGWLRLLTGCAATGGLAYLIFQNI